MGDSTAKDLQMSSETPPTQVMYPIRAILRTFIAAAVSAFVTWATSIGIDIATFAPGLTDLLTSALWAVLTALVTWVLTKPGVNAWLQKYMPLLAATPRK